MVTVTCQWKGCRKHFQARQADINRGWGKFCSKSCKAKEQEARTGQYHAYKENSSESIHDQAMREMELGWDGHKDLF